MTPIESHSDGLSLSAKERAEKILLRLNDHNSTLARTLNIGIIAAQIEEAEREAVLYSAPYAEGKKDGFHAAREKAAEIAEWHVDGWRKAIEKHTERMELELAHKYREMIFIVEPIARGIRAMEVGDV